MSVNGSHVIDMVMFVLVQSIWMPQIDSASMPLDNKRSFLCFSSLELVLCGSVERKN